jgi:hypothetical protein
MPIKEQIHVNYVDKTNSTITIGIEENLISSEYQHFIIGTTLQDFIDQAIYYKKMDKESKEFLKHIYRISYRNLKKYTVEQVDKSFDENGEIWYKWSGAVIDHYHSRLALFNTPIPIVSQFMEDDLLEKLKCIMNDV